MNDLKLTRELASAMACQSVRGRLSVRGSGLCFVKSNCREGMSSRWRGGSRVLALDVKTYGFF